jgi:chromosome segregation ATPase
MCPNVRNTIAQDYLKELAEAKREMRQLQDKHDTLTSVETKLRGQHDMQCRRTTTLDTEVSSLQRQVKELTFCNALLLSKSVDVSEENINIVKESQKLLKTNKILCVCALCLMCILTFATTPRY